MIRSAFDWANENLIIIVIVALLVLSFFMGGEKAPSGGNCYLDWDGRTNSEFCE